MVIERYWCWLLFFGCERIFVILLAFRERVGSYDGFFIEVGEVGGYKAWSEGVLRKPHCFYFFVFLRCHCFLGRMFELRQ